MASVLHVSQVTPRSSSQESSRTPRNKINGIYLSGGLSHECTELSAERTGFSSAGFSAGAAQPQASPRGSASGVPRKMDMRSTSGPPTSSPRNNGDSSLCRAVMDETDYIVQRLSGCIVKTFEQESRVLHQRMTEELIAQRQVLQESLSRIEEMHERLDRGDAAKTIQTASYDEPVTVRSPSMRVERSAEDPVCERDNNNGVEYGRACPPRQLTVLDGWNAQLDGNVEADGTPSTKDSHEGGKPGSTAGDSAMRRLLDVSSAVAGAIADADGIDFTMAGAKKQFFLGLAKKVPSGPIRMSMERTAHVIDWWENLEEPKRTNAVARVVENPAFEFVSMAVVVADQGLTTWSANYGIANMTDEMPEFQTMTSHFFTAFFAVELVLKLFVHRLYFFCCGQWKMNCLDMFLVSYSFLEAIAMRLSFLRVLRMFKMAKIVRMLKALTAVHDLRIMLDCLLGSFFGLFWSLVLILVIMYVFALIYVQALTDYMIAAGDTLAPSVQQDILEYFGSVQTGALSVYLMLTGGKDWGELYALLVRTDSIGGPACLVMIAFFTISVWNIITSVFIEKAMKLAQPSVRDLVKQHRDQAKEDAREVAALFARVDHDSTGRINRREFKEICADVEVQEFLAVRDLRIHALTDYDAFFDMILRHDSPNFDSVKGRSKDDVSVKSLVEVFLHLKGNATNLDLHKRYFALGAQMRGIFDALTTIQTNLQIVQKKLSPLDFGFRV